jgi:cytoskeleton protein RodZ
MTFSRESWVEVRDRRGKVIFSQLNPEGSEQVVRGRPPLSVVVGNVSGVTLVHEGKPVDLSPYARTEVARLTLE